MKAHLGKIGRKKSILITLAAGCLGFIINLFPIEIFPGIHLIFGSTAALVIAILFGPGYGTVSGLMAGLRTWFLWNQPVPASMLLYGLEGAAVGWLNTRFRRMRLLAAVLLYWIVLGGWLNLAVQYYLFKLPFETALFIQIRSVVNGLICGLLAEALLLLLSLGRRFRDSGEKLRPVSMASVISLFLTIGISLPILYASTSYASQVREGLVTKTNEANLLHINSTTGEVSSLLESYKGALELAAALIESEGKPTQERLQAVLAITRQRYPVFAGLYVADLKATTIAFDPQYNEKGEYLVGLNYSDREYYREIMATKRTNYSNVYHGRGGTPLPCISIGVPLRDKEGEMWGFVLGWFDLRSFQTLVRRNNFTKGVQMVITDRNGKLIADSTLSEQQHLEIKDYSNTQPYKISSANNNGSLLYTVTTGQQSAVVASKTFKNSYWLTYSTIQAPGWKLWINQSTDPIDRQIAGLYLKTIIIVFVLILLAAAFAHIVSRFIVDPLRQLQLNAEQIAAGNFSARPAVRSVLTSEVGSLVASFKKMAAELEHAFDKQRSLFEEISRRESELQNLVASAHDAIFTLSREGKILWLNERTAALLGEDSTSLKGRVFQESIVESDRKMAAEQFARSMEGSPYTIEFRCKDREGKVKDLLVTASPIRTGDEISGALFIARDITDQKQAKERALRADKLRAMGQLATGVAHNFNNALAAILGRAQLLKLKTDEPYFVNGLTVIERAALDSANMVKRIQTFSRRKRQEQFMVEDINLLVQDAVELTRTRWEDDARVAGKEYEVEVRTAKKATVNAIASELREVFVNLIINALDAMPNGGSLVITVTCEKQQVQVQFKDSGIGMGNDVKEHLFEPFFTTKGMSGTGLGLSVSYGIISRHNGSISVESEPDRGTTFTIQLPFAAPSYVLARNNGKSSLHKLNILVIDDEQMVRETLAEYLELEGHQVKAVGDGDDWLDLLKHQHFDVVITDLSMPKVDGYHVALVVRQGWPQTRVLMATGYGDGIDQSLIDDGTIEDVISKPFDMAQINACLQKLDTKQSQRKERHQQVNAD